MIALLTDGIRWVGSLNRPLRHGRPCGPSVRTFVLCAAWSMLGLPGCIGPWRPPRNHVSEPPPLTHVSQFRRCLAANRVGRWVYERRPLPEREGRPTRTHVRQVGVGRLSEGLLDDRSFLRIERYLDLGPQATSRPADTVEAGSPTPLRPRAPLEGGTGIFFRLAESADPIPPELESVSAITGETRVTYYDYRGIPQATGALKRVTELEGIEDVETPAGRFEACYRVRVDLTIRFPWLAIIDLTHYLWLSPEVGEVRRVQRLTGWFLIFPFASADEYRLVSCSPSAASARAVEMPPPRWQSGAVLLEGDYPTLRIAGMVIDLDVPEPGR